MAEKYNFKEKEPQIQQFWEEQDIFKFDEKSAKEFYSIDTPPPTVSGKMHMGHAMSYTQQDIIEIDVEEGDVLVFPSFVIHKGPQNISTNKKTIISYNTNIVYSDNIYGQGLEE